MYLPYDCRVNEITSFLTYIRSLLFSISLMHYLRYNTLQLPPIVKVSRCAFIALRWIPLGVSVAGWRACPLDPLRQSGSQSCCLFGPLLGRLKVDRSHVPCKGEACNCNKACKPSLTLALHRYSPHILDHSVVLWKEVSVSSV